jgi:predicted Zn-dependent protease
MVAVFGMAILAANQVDWMTLFDVEENVSSTEEELGDLIWESISKTNEVVEEDEIIMPIDSILSKLCAKNNIDREDIKLHVVYNNQVNAFALPNNHLVVYTGLLESVENEAELAGVLGHELAHLELDHVMKKLVKEIGLAVIISLTAGNGNTEVLLESVKTLTSSAYDRSLETDADLKSVDYMIEADINPGSFADFLYLMGSSDDTAERYMSWVSSHPYSKERAEKIIEYSQEQTYENVEILAPKTWKLLKAKVH